jgi:hypothetical protein
VNRFVALLLVMLAVGALCLLSWYGPPRSSRRATSVFLEQLDLEPIVSGAAVAARGDAQGAAAGSWERSSRSDPAVSGGRSNTHFWKRRYDTASWTITATLDSAQSRTFLAAVRESLDRHLADVGATTRDVDAAAWIGAAGGPGLSDPLALEVPYATRRRVGWLTVHARHAGATALTVWVTVHEGPRPSE